MRIKINATGIVQGVGFRPFIYRIAVKNSLNGYVKNKGERLDRLTQNIKFWV